MFEAFVDGKRREVVILFVNDHSLTVAFLKSLAGQSTRYVRTIPYSRFSWKSDNWYEVSRKITA